MWFKNLTVFRFTEPFTLNAEALAENLNRTAFRPCSSQELFVQGWIPPLGRKATDLVHAANGCLLVCLQTEEKVLPAAVIHKAIAEKVAEIEDREGRSLRRQEKELLREDIVQELLPRAFTRNRHSFAYIEPRGQWLIVDGSARRTVEGITTRLRKTLGSLPITVPRVASSPAAVMTDWLSSGEIAPDFTWQDECELRDGDEEGAGVVRCKGQDLTGAEILTHLQAGKQVTRIALTWDQKITFVLSEDLSIRRLRFLDVIQEQLEDIHIETAEARFDAEFALMTGELSLLLPRLLELFGGEVG